MELLGCHYNLGFIKWSEDLNSVSFDGEYQFTGVDLTLLNVDSIGDMLEMNWILSDKILLQKQEVKALSTALAPSVYLGGYIKLIMR